MTTSRGLALGLLVLAALGYALAAVPVLLGGAIYPTMLGGETPISGPVGPVFAASALLAAFLAFDIRRDASDRDVRAGFTAWLVLAAVAAVVTVPLVGASIALTAVLPLALVRPTVRDPSRSSRS